MNHYRLAEYFWAEGGRSIPNALFASRLFIAMSHSEVLTRHGHFRETVLKMERMSKKFETLALGVLDECHLDDSDRARKILRVKLNHFRLVWEEGGRMGGGGVGEFGRLVEVGYDVNIDLVPFAAAGKT